VVVCPGIVEAVGNVGKGGKVESVGNGGNVESVGNGGNVVGVGTGESAVLAIVVFVVVNLVARVM